MRVVIYRERNNEIPKAVEMIAVIKWVLRYFCSTYNMLAHVGLVPRTK